nr:synaptotagmin-like protein 1 isoform X1 [Chrysemys picta bellii]XP_023963408.1 synaptotagmin-like protein 1 isoform X2 [Chrysemys picta bellii]XP_023963409.1 synaptotagmin-like protein 1 isoform X1 [Chrysemys picta bellii]XP_042700598.1 synaptotagmin-like protein 1 isoform X1 [Chrysemys picta bellii]
MAQDIDTDALLDLSFLTEEEQEAIVEVLSRDSRLRVLEEGRISKLRESVSDPNQLKVLTGDWFCDVRSKRHRHNHFGSDLVRASIRRKKKPKGERDPKRSASVGDLEVISEPASEEEGPFEVPDGEDRLPQEAVHQLPQPTETQENAIQSSKQEPEGKAESTNPFYPLNAEEEEAKTDPSPNSLVTGQSNGAFQNGQEASTTSPPKSNSADPVNKLMSSSVSSLSSSTLSGSMMSLYSDSDVGNVEVRGCVQFALQYEAKKKELQIRVIQCRDLAEAKKQRSDPYVKSYLLPDKSNQGKRKTAVKKRSLDPIFNETLKYKIEQAELPGRILNLSVWHHDALGRNLFMGEVEVELSSWDWSNTGPAWFNLQPRLRVLPDVLGSRGKLLFALKFIPVGTEGAGLPPTGELHIWVKAAQSLMPIRSGTVDSFVQCYVLPDDSKTSCQKTRVVKRSLSPMFNHTMVYDGFQAKDLSEACAEFTVWEHETFSKQQLGGIRLSLGTGSSYGLPVAWMDSTEEERQVWESLLAEPRQWVEALLPLRTNLTPRT